MGGCAKYEFSTEDRHILDHLHARAQIFAVIQILILWVGGFHHVKIDLYMGFLGSACMMFARALIFCFLLKFLLKK